MDGTDTVEITVLGVIDEIAAADWDACAAPEAADGGRALHPFLTHRFLSAFEASGSVQPRAGWAPRHLAARAGGRVLGVSPMYVKGHSQGEYIFDHSWAHAYERAGGAYYPKLLSAVPFTPVTGPRFLARPGIARETAAAALIEGAAQLAVQGGFSSVHWNFCTAQEAELGAAMGLLRRSGQQFHWQDAGYGDFDGAGRRRHRTRPLGRVLAVLSGHRRAQMGLSVPDARFFPHRP